MAAIGLSPLLWTDAGGDPRLLLLDQTRLPAAEVTLACRHSTEVVAAIQRLAVRGAPLLGLVGGYGVALAAARGEDVAVAADRLATARPTAVNLARAVQRVRDVHQRVLATDGPAAAAAAALAAARELHAADAAAAERMAAAGVTLVPPGARILTHCNTGRLVSGGPGTALGVVLAAHQRGLVAQLWVDETRPLLQGARLTAYEAARAGVPHAVVADAAAGGLFSRGLVDLVLVGADRIAADGSVANKVGTYPLAVLAERHRVPFVVVAPTSTIDPATPDAAAIPIEERPPAEVTTLAGIPVAPPASPAHNPAFDITPAELVTALVTEAGTARPVNGSTVAQLCAAGTVGATMDR